MAARYVAKIVKFMLSNPADLKRLAAIKGISFSKYVKGKIDCDVAGVDPAIALLQEQVKSLQDEIAGLSVHGAAPQVVRQQGGNADRDKTNVNEWFEE